LNKAHKNLSCLLGLITAFAIFFQFHVTLPEGVINLNLGDPFALAALVAVCLNSLMLRSPPQWRVPQFNLILMMFGALLLIGFANGWFKIGVTQWSLSARLIGSIVLLGYLAAGYLLVAYNGNSSIRRMLEVLAITATIVIVWTALMRTLSGYGFEVPWLTPNYEGFSGNRNAFAFQLLAVLAVALAYSNTYSRQFTGEAKGIFTAWRSWVPIGFLIAGVFLTASRAGALAGIIILAIAVVKDIANRKSVVFGILFAGILWSALWAVQSATVQRAIEQIASMQSDAEEGNSEQTGTAQDGTEQGATAQSGTAQSEKSKSGKAKIDKAWTEAAQSATVQSAVSGEYSNEERIATLVYGFKMWRNSPFLGEGLGVFIANSESWLGRPTVIHNTPLWILAEFGLLGAVIFGWSFLKIGRYAIDTNHSRNNLSRSALLLLITLFVVFSLFHEMLYQRIFWLIGGALLATPLAFRSRDS
jgi:hypothetical protein